MRRGFGVSHMGAPPAKAAKQFTVKFQEKSGAFVTGGSYATKAGAEAAVERVLKSGIALDGATVTETK